MNDIMKGIPWKNLRSDIIKSILSHITEETNEMERNIKHYSITLVGVGVCGRSS